MFSPSLNLEIYSTILFYPLIFYYSLFFFLNSFSCLALFLVISLEIVWVVKPPALVYHTECHHSIFAIKEIFGTFSCLWLSGFFLYSKIFLVLWGCRIVCILTSRYLVSLLPVSIIHVSDIFLVGFWSWEKKFYYVGLLGLGLAGGQDQQRARTWVSVSSEMVGFPAPIGWPGASQPICTQ